MTKAQKKTIIYIDKLYNILLILLINLVVLMQNTIHSDLIRGHINTIILKALFEGDRYGYDIIKEIEQKSSGQYKLKQPTLYSCLKRLEVQGFIESYWGAKSNGGRRKYYTLTDMGKELFVKNQSEWEYSRTVIDKLISDKEYDFSKHEVTHDDYDNSIESGSEDGEDYVDLENEFTQNDDDEIAIESVNLNDNNEDENNFDSSLIDNDLLQSISTVNDDIKSDSTYDYELKEDNFDDDVEEINIDSFREDNTNDSYLNLNDHLDSQDLNNYTPNSDNYAYEHDFLDTAVLIDELFKKQNEDSSVDSYSNKLKNEDYIAPVHKTNSELSSNDYFNDNFTDDSSNYQIDDSQEQSYTQFNSSTVENDNSDKRHFNIINYNQHNHYTNPAQNSDNVQTSSIDNSYVNSNDNLNDYDNTQNDSNYQGYNQNVYNQYESGMQDYENATEEAQNNYDDMFMSYKTDINAKTMDESKLYLEREYKNILAELVKNQTTSVPEAPPIESVDPASIPITEEMQTSIDYYEPEPIYEEEPIFIEPQPIAQKIVAEPIIHSKTDNRQFDKLSASIKDLGENVKIRTPNSEVSRIYSSDNYYYSNKLMLRHFGILGLIMAFELIICFLFIKVFAGIEQSIDMSMYIIATVIAIAFPVFAACVNMSNPEKKKRIVFDFRTSLAYRALIFAACLVIIYSLNMLINRNVSLKMDNLATIILPTLYSFNFIISVFIFNILYKSKKYAVE